MLSLLCGLTVFFSEKKTKTKNKDKLYRLMTEEKKR